MESALEKMFKDLQKSIREELSNFYISSNIIEGIKAVFFFF